MPAGCHDRSPAADSKQEIAQKRREAAAARWKLITELALERESAAARRITPDTYILCPRPPELATPERLAA